MSIEIVFHPNKATRDELRRFLEARSYQPTTHLWDWPKGSLNYHWFDSTDYRSYDGVEATIYPPTDKKQLKQLGDCNWALHTRTRASASPADRAQQNGTIRAARKIFGGQFYNDWHGKGRYTPPDDDGRDARARGIYLLYEFVMQNIRAVKYALPEPSQQLEKLVGSKLEALSEVDPTRVLYNALVPFAVAALEHFFSETFKIMLRYDDATGKRLEKQTRKVELADVLAIQERRKSLEDVVAGWYSFQNIASIHSAFSEWFGIDIWGLLRKRRKIGRRIGFLEERLSRLIEFRHSIIHGFSINFELRKPEIEELLELAGGVIDTFVDYLEKEYGTGIR